jgi:predicted Na+-dependent transporter
MFPIEKSKQEDVLNLKAILTGAAVDLSGTFNTEILINLMAGSMWWMGPEHWTIFYAANMVRGLFFTGMGGYFSARAAGRDYMKHALVTGTISTGISVALAIAYYLNMAGDGQIDASIFVLFGVFANLPAALLGGLFYASTTKTQNALPPD